ncbi:TETRATRICOPEPTIDE REPEAT FAMILY PROTEIN [plant metagenome]|uniref:TETRATRICOPEPTIDE REPEAT FAMILY PROTEIN n=1 Tax=plant metagenome TaxID=1297885 RepID=A0A484S447_9ZZZZ
MKETAQAGRLDAPTASSHRLDRSLAFLALGCAAALSPAALAAEWASPSQKYQMALEAQSVGEYTRMVALLREAGEADHVPAQEMLGMALLAGPTVYGEAVPTDRCEAGKWMRRAAAQGSELGKTQWAFLHRLRNAPSGEDVCQTQG